MNKKKLHHLWVKLRPISHRYFLILFIATAIVAVFALRQNNFKMIRLREAVMVADEKGEGLEETLQALRRHVYGHMNTDLTSGNAAIHPPIQLTKTYERLVSAERDRVAAVNRRVSDEAEELCERRFPAGQLQSGRVPCVQEYITKHSVSEKPIPKELYQFDFVSPIWSPDLAGWSLIAAGVFLMLFVLRFGLEHWLKHQLE